MLALYLGRTHPQFPLTSPRDPLHILPTYLLFLTHFVITAARGNVSSSSRLEFMSRALMPRLGDSISWLPSPPPSSYKLSTPSPLSLGVVAIRMSPLWLSTH